MKVESINNRRIRREGQGRSFLSRLFVPAFCVVTLFPLLMTTGCSNEKLDPLVEPRHIEDLSSERTTMVVEKGDLVPIFEASATLAGFNETDYRVDSNQIDDMETMYEITGHELKVSVGDSVKAGDVLVSFSSKVLDEKLKDNQTKVTEANLEIEHLEKLQAIDPSLDYSGDIAELNEDIGLANKYIEDINETYASLNLVATEDIFI